MKSDERTHAMKSNNTIDNRLRLRLLFSKLKSVFVIVVTTLPLLLVHVLFVQVGQVQAFGTTTSTQTAPTIATRATRRRRRSAAHAYTNYPCSVSSPSSTSTSRLFETRRGSSDNIDIMQGDDDSSQSAKACDCTTTSLQFGRFTLSSQQIFYTSPTALSAAIVNLRPIVPGHVLVISTRVVPHLSDLTQEEYVDLWTTVRKVQNMLGTKYLINAAAKATGGDASATANTNAPTASAFNVAVQDGRGAGQSVPHVHVHILPRSEGDFQRNDDVYDELEAWAPTAKDAEVKTQQLQNAKLEVLEDADRRDRTMQQMGEEAEEYRRLMDAMQ